MSDQIKHECGIALVHLKKPLHFYQQKYGSYMYGVDKMFLMMEKQKIGDKMVPDTQVLSLI